MTAPSTLNRKVGIVTALMLLLFAMVWVFPTAAVFMLVNGVWMGLLVLLVVTVLRDKDGAAEVE